MLSSIDSTVKAIHTLLDRNYLWDEGKDLDTQVYILFTQMLSDYDVPQIIVDNGVHKEAILLLLSRITQIKLQENETNAEHDNQLHHSISLTSPEWKTPMHHALIAGFCRIRSLSYQSYD